MSHTPEATQTEDVIRYCRKIVADRVALSRTERRKIFSWASAILVAITGGVVAIIYREPTPRFLLLSHRIALTIAVVAVAADALVCMRKHWKIEIIAGKALADYDDKLGIPHLTMPGWPPAGDHGLPLALLTAAALLVTWLAAV